MTDILATEWIKLCSARSTRYVLGVIALFTALMPLIAWYFVRVWDTLPEEGRQHSALGPLPALMGWIASLCMAVFGSLAISSEYSSGMIRATFTAMPRRIAVLAAKASVVAGLAFVLTEASLATTEVAGMIIVGNRPIAGQAPPGLGEVALLVAMGMSTATFALIGLAIGAITRSALASVVALTLVWYAVPLIATHLPGPWSTVLMSIEPGALAGELVGGTNANSVFGSALPAWAALAAMTAYASLPVAVAMAVLERRDA